jgi:hypothetical protein
VVQPFSALFTAVRISSTVMIPVVVHVTRQAVADGRAPEGDVHHREAFPACRRQVTRAAGISSQSMDPSALAPGVMLHPSLSLAWVFVAVEPFTWLFDDNGRGVLDAGLAATLRQ